MRIENEILKNRQEWLIEKIEKINKKAKKLGFTPFVLTFANERLVEIKNEVTGKVQKSYIVIDATIEGETPKIEGWELISIFESINAVVFTRTVPGKELTYNPTKITCEHCNINRPRKKSYYLQNVDTKEFKEVGSTCLKDFIGHDPKAFMTMAEFNFETILNEANNGSREGYNGYNLEEFLAMTKAIINKYGWTSAASITKMQENGKDTYGIRPTSDDVANQFHARRNPQYFPNFEYIDATDEDFEFGKKAIEYFKNITEQNDYINNIKKIFEIGFVPNRKEGLAASIVGSYYVHLQKQIQKENTKPSEYVGTVGIRNKGMELTYTGRYGYESDFGYINIHLFKDFDGNVYKWNSGNKIDAEFGDTIILDGTIKKHEEYKNIKQTILTRCTIKKIVAKG